MKIQDHAKIEHFKECSIFIKKNTWYGTVVKYAVIADWTGAVTRILASWSRTQVKMELFDNTTLTTM